MEPTLHYLDMPGPKAKHSDERRLAWWEWNATGQSAPGHVVVCVHGLTRQSRDFDVLAQALAPHACVVSVDVAGRGHSDWLADPMDYQIPNYAMDLGVLLAHLRQRHAQQSPEGIAGSLRISWVGTSMGGLIGMALAAQPGIGLARLVLNDVGPVIEMDALRRIADYVGQPVVFESEQAAADALWRASPTFGPHTQEQWLALTRPMLRPVPHGWGLHYDPSIGIPFRHALANTTAEGARKVEAAMWQLYDAILAPTLLLRGTASDLLSQTTAQAMSQRGPHAACVEFAGVGHAPTLIVPDQVTVVTDFLLAE